MADAFHLSVLRKPESVPSSLGPVVHLLRAKRDKSGFWTPPPEVGRTTKRIPIPELGVTCATDMSGNVLYGSGSLVLEEGAARWFDLATNKLVAVAEFNLLQNTEEVNCYRDHTVMHYLDEYSETSLEFALALGTHFPSIADLLKNRGSVVHFTRLETNPKWYARQQGLKMGEWLMRTIDLYCKPALFLLEPYPLQYRNGVMHFVEPGEVIDESGFAAAREKLHKLYETAWNAVRLDERYSAVSFHNEFKVFRPGPRWECALRERLQAAPESVAA